MKTGKWITSIILFMAVTALGFAGFNYLTDPFGVFGDKLMNWYSYNMTMNPRVAKIEYLEDHHNEYDSYIIGCSKTSAFSVDTLNEYYDDANFYNMIMYGGDMYDIKVTAEYIIENYKPENIVINLGLEEANRYDYTEDETKNGLHPQVEGEDTTGFYLKKLFQNPQYGINKINDYINRTYLPQAFDVFVPETGEYNKSKRDSEAIGDLDTFMENNPDFIYDTSKRQMNDMDKTVEAIKTIKELCEENDIDFKLIMCPIYYQELNTYTKDELTEYWNKIAEVTDFWDFSGYGPLSYDERYYYDQYHFRNSVGDMVLARIFDDQSTYIPEGFGHYTTGENAEERANEIFANVEIPDSDDYTKQIPILMFHNISSEGDPGTNISPDEFKKCMQLLKENGYSTVSFSDLRSYVNEGAGLPEKPIIITFDDGYESNHEYAYPIMQEEGMQGTINIIGMSVGKSTYKDTDKVITPHFDYTEAREMYESGVIDIQSHSFEMHLSPDHEEDPREGVYQMKGESEEEYIEFFTSDVIKSKRSIEENVGNDVFVFAYPLGFYTPLSEALLKENEYEITLTINPGMNTVIKGLPQSMFALNRFNVDHEAEELIEILERSY